MGALATQCLSPALLPQSAGWRASPTVTVRLNSPALHGQSSPSVCWPMGQQAAPRHPCPPPPPPPVCTRDASQGLAMDSGDQSLTISNEAPWARHGAIVGQITCLPCRASASAYCFEGWASGYSARIHLCCMGCAAP